jgi:hypothetical protein
MQNSVWNVMCNANNLSFTESQPIKPISECQVTLSFGKQVGGADHLGTWNQNHQQPLEFPCQTGPNPEIFHKNSYSTK